MPRPKRPVFAVFVLCAVAATAAAQTATVVVTSTSSAIDGNISSISSLIASPGFDGVSLMEAIAAANNTFGPKKITFGPELLGKSIGFGSNDFGDIGRFSLKSPELTIDGDIDGDGKPDVTLDATGRDLTTIHIRAGNITIQNLIFREFGGEAINFACEDTTCLSRTISHVRIAGNVFDSQRGGAVQIGVLGLLGNANNPLLSGFSYSDIVIDHNTVRGPIDRFMDGIAVRVCSDGVANGRYDGVAITNNDLRIHTAIDASAADEAAPPNYSDRCTLENFLIDGNLIQDASVGIYFDTSNLGNQHNATRHIRITNNRILRARRGMSVGAANLPDPTRDTSFNTMTDLLVAGNEIAGSERAMLLTAGNWPLNAVAPTGVDDNTLTGAAIVNNHIHDYRFTGLQVYGAVGASSSGPHTSSRNRIDGLTISGNTFETTTDPRDFPVGLEIVAGESNGRTAAGNEVRHVVVAGNIFRGNHPAIFLIGGRRPGSTGNLLSLDAITPNTFENNAQDVVTIIDAEGASGNRIEIVPRRRAARR